MNSDILPIFRLLKSSARKTIGTAGLLLLFAGCAQTYGPSVPSQPGKSFLAARNAVLSCVPAAPKAGQQAVVGGYVAGVVLGGLILGPAVVAVQQENIRYNGEASGVDKCLARSGYTRRDLTPEELDALNQSYGEARLRLLDQLVAGGTLTNTPQPEDILPGN